MISVIKIRKLFGYLNYDIKVKRNKLILVAENGSGKTTIVNIIYYFLSRQWSKLSSYDFSSIEVIINGESIKVSKSEIEITSNKNISKILREYSPVMRERINRIFSKYSMSSLRHTRDWELIARKYNIPHGLLRELMYLSERGQMDIFSSSIDSRQKRLDNLFPFKILYLPTFRRIERDLSTIFPYLEEELSEYRSRQRRRDFSISETNKGYLELVEFGMQDVESMISSKLRYIRDELSRKLKNDLTGTYLKDVINRTYLKLDYNHIQSFNEVDFESIINRIEDEVLSKSEKAKLKKFVEDIKRGYLIEKQENKIIAHFLFRLAEIYNEQKEQEKDIVNFIRICNDYSNNKIFEYNNTKFQIEIFPIRRGKMLRDEGNRIFFKDLSSGEKQIVSLFAQIYLSKTSNYFVIIDEPELSLSVPWQRRFLQDIMDNNKCNGLLAVTHSPFIFENQLERYAHGLNEFSV